MAKEGSVAETNRVNLVCTVVDGGQKVQKELPCKVLVMADIWGRDDSRPISKREPLNINKDNFQDVLAAQKLSVRYEVDNKLSGKPNEKMEVRLNPRKLDDFHPDNLVDQVPELRAVYAIRQALSELRGNLSQNKEFRKQLESLLAMLGKERDPERRSEFLSDIGIGPMPDKR